VNAEDVTTTEGQHCAGREGAQQGDGHLQSDGGMMVCKTVYLQAVHAPISTIVHETQHRQSLACELQSCKEGTAFGGALELIGSVFEAVVLTYTYPFPTTMTNFEGYDSVHFQVVHQED
jgi:hypothetical protein